MKIHITLIGPDYGTRIPLGIMDVYPNQTVSDKIPAFEEMILNRNEQYPWRLEIESDD